MGLLDDAIRQHLELKRKHGGDRDEIARLEDEALSPVVRTDKQPTSGNDADSVLDDASASSPKPVTPTSGNHFSTENEPKSGASQSSSSSSFTEERSSTGKAFEEQPTVEFHEQYGDGRSSLADQAGHVLQDELSIKASRGGLLGDAEVDGSTKNRVSDGLGQRRITDAVAKPNTPDGPGKNSISNTSGSGSSSDTNAGDLLDGTPDFLKETPEHERLWFEQKPPKDFDFDR